MKPNKVVWIIFDNVNSFESFCPIEEKDCALIKGEAVLIAMLLVVLGMVSNNNKYIKSK